MSTATEKQRLNVTNNWDGRHPIGGYLIGSGKKDISPELAEKLIADGNAKMHDGEKMKTVRVLTNWDGRHEPGVHTLFHNVATQLVIDGNAEEIKSKGK